MVKKKKLKKENLIVIDVMIIALEVIKLAIRTDKKFALECVDDLIKTIIEFKKKVKK